jgi:glycosyltransferase involved in cell wall biosynthesis
MIHTLSCNAKILYLYAEVMAYTMATLKALVEAGAEVHVVHWDDKKLTPYRMPAYRQVYTYSYSQHTLDSLMQLAATLQPDVTVVSGWQEQRYLKVARRLRQQGRVVVTAFDGQWQGGLKQYLAAGLGLMGFFSRYFSHAWVAGAYQFEYARRLGFHKNNIVFDLLSADLSLFQNCYQSHLDVKQIRYPHRFLFVGRFEPIKGLDTLLAAWQTLRAAWGDWELHLIGNGSLKERLMATPGIVVKDFMEPDQLVNELAESGCLILPSLGEPWGVVVHEFAAAGLPLIVSDVVGAATTFLVSGLNGYTFKVNDVGELAKAIGRIINLSDPHLMEMSHASHRLSNRITPLTSARNLLSLLPK